MFNNLKLRYIYICSKNSTINNEIDYYNNVYSNEDTS